MGKKSGPTPPPAPDPKVTAQAQSEANIATAREQQRLNMINTAGPQGAVRYEVDPTAPGGYRQVTSLSPEEQAIYDAQKKTELGATNTAYDQLGRVQTALQTPLDTTGLPGLAGGLQLGAMAGQGVQTSFDKGGPLRYGFDPGQQVQGQVGGDLNTARQQAIDATYQQATSRLDPQFETQRKQLETRLANQGLGINSEAYQNALNQFDRTKTDAYNQANYSSIGAGENAANALFNRQLGQGQFANQAAAQMYGQNLGQAQFNNQTAGQDYSQNLGAAQFNNTAQQQAFQQQLQAGQFRNEARNQGLQERAYLQNQPINQLTGLLSLGQVGMPQGVQYTPSQVGQTDVLGAYALNQQAQNAAYQAKMQQNSGLMGGLFSLGSAAIMASDRRLKTDIRLLRRRKDGTGVYAYRYRGEDVTRIGVMADEIRKVRPDLVVKRPDGFLAVNYAGLDLEAA